MRTPPPHVPPAPESARLLRLRVVASGVGTALPFVRALGLTAGLLALCAAPAAAASAPSPGAAFGNPRLLTTVNGFAAAPAIGQDGRAAVVVSDYSAQRSRILAFIRSPRGRWADPLAVRTSRHELLEPRAAFTGDGTGIFTWMRAARIDQEQIVEARSLLGSARLEPVRTISAPGTRAIFARVAGGPGRRTLVGWETGDYALQVADGGVGGFTPSRSIFERRQSAFSIAYLRDGTAVALSQAYGAGGVQVRMRPPGADWGAPVTLSGARTAREATLATGSDGTIAVAWAQSTGAGYRVQISRRPPGGVFSAARTIGGDDGEGRAPGLAVQPDGTALVAWLSGARTSFLLRAAEVKMATISPAGAVSTARRVSGPRRRAGVAPQVFADAEGDALVTWEENRRLLGATRSASGRISQPRVISAAGARIFASRVVANPRGQALAAWTVERGRTDDGALIQMAEMTF